MLLAGREIARDVKEKLCNIGVDYDTKLKSRAETDKEKTYELPDGNFIIVGAKRFLCVKFFCSQVSPVKKSADSTTLLSAAS